MTFKEILSTQELVSTCQLLMNQKLIALDTEFHRTAETYWPLPCLIQIATDKETFIIDPKLVDLGPLKDVLTNPSVKKILHSCRQDLEVFYFALQCDVVNIFDTQVAALFVGNGVSAGYEALVKQYLDVSVKKDYQHSAWHQRPLSREQLSYAAQDVQYLIPLYYLLSERLKKSTRWEWMEEEMAEWGQQVIHDIKPKMLLARLGNIEAMGRVQAINQWRHDTARRLNINKKQLINTEAMITIAEEKIDADEMSLIAPLIVEHYLYNELSALLDREHCFVDHTILTRSQKHARRLCQKILKQVSKDYKIPPFFIANSEELDRFCREGMHKKGWREKIFWSLCVEKLKDHEQEQDLDSATHLTDEELAQEDEKDELS